MPAEVVAQDYARSADAVPEILARLRRLPSYADRIDLLPADVHACSADTMSQFLTAVTGSTAPWRSSCSRPDSTATS